jgi:hypothetical protein
LAVVLLLIIVLAVVFGVVWNQVRKEEIESQELTQVLAEPELIGTEDEPLEVPAEFVASAPAGTIILDLRHARFDVVPAAPGEPLRVHAKFDTNHYGLSESFNQGPEGEGWIYEVEFRRTSGSYALTTLKELLGGTRPRVTIHLPKDVPYDLELDIVQGGAEVELGGLWLANADIRFLQGGGELRISEPLPIPAESVSIDFSQAGGAVFGIANASPAIVDVTFSMGGGYLDLRGPWLGDAEIMIDQSMGGVSVHLPKNAVLRGIGRFDTEEPAQAGEEVPVLRFSTSSHFGELEFLK